MQLFEISVHSEAYDTILLVVAESEADARRLAGSRGDVRAVDANHGSFVIRGQGRIIGDVERPAAVHSGP